jgi:hypothetical protein
MFMKKLYLALVALVAFATTASAGHKNLYKQDFETAKTPAIAGWKSPNLADGMSIKSDEEGTYFQFDLGGNNNRNAALNFNYGLEDGKSIFDVEGLTVKEYTVKFTWGLIANPQSTGKPQDVQFSSELAVLNDKWDHNFKSKGYFVNNGQYATADSLYLFALTQLKGAWQAADEEKGIEQTPYWTDNTDLSSYAFDFYINNDKNKVVTLTEGHWYDITITVNTETRTAQYEIFSQNDNMVVTGGTGTYNIPENASVWAKGFNVLLGRYKSVAQFDDFKVQAHTDTDIANDPTIALTGVDQKKRTYKIFFEDSEGEILNVKGTEGNTIQEVKSPYEYTTETSGTLEAWTELGRGESNHVKVDVVAEVINLPAAAIDITKVNAGYVKTLKMTVDNAEVPTQPQITLTWEYSNGDKSTGEVLSGEIYNASEKGTLTVTTHAYGFGETTSTFENNTEFAVDKTIDFQHMTEAELTAKGFAEIDELRADKMSGEGNWTARSYLYYNIETGETKDDGTPIVEKHVVYGPTTNAEAEGIRRFYLKPSTLTKTVATTIFAPFYTWYTGQADETVADGSDVAGLKMNYGIGLINTGTKTDDGTAINYPNGIVGVDGLTDNDYYIAYVISNYGSTSKHPTYPAGTTEAEGKALYKAENLGDGDNVQVLRGTETYSLYRIDTAIARIDIFKAVADPTGIETLPYNQIVSDHNAPIYNLNGVQVNPNALQKGIYIKQGKKFVVK